MAGRRWSEEEHWIALDAYFRVGEPRAGDDNVAAAATTIGRPPEAMLLKLMEFHLLDKGGAEDEVKSVASASRKFWECFVVAGEGGKTLARKRAAEAVKRKAPRKKNISRREARQAAMQIAYAFMAQNISAADAFAGLRQTRTLPYDRALLSDSLVLAAVKTLDDKRDGIARLLAASAGRSPSRISAVERAIMYAAVAERLARPRVDRDVVMDEAVKIAAIYGSEGGHKIVNRALDGIADSALAVLRAAPDSNANAKSVRADA